MQRPNNNSDTPTTKTRTGEQENEKTGKRKNKKTEKREKEIVKSLLSNGCSGSATMDCLCFNGSSLDIH